MHEANHLSPYNSKVKNAWTCTCTPHLHLYGVDRDNLNRGWKQWKICLRWHGSVYYHQNKFMVLYVSGWAWGPVIIMLFECDYVPLNSVKVLIFSLAKRLVVSQEGLCCTGVIIFCFCCTHICKFLKFGFMRHFDGLIFIPRQNDVFILKMLVRLSSVCNKLYTSL